MTNKFFNPVIKYYVWPYAILILIPIALIAIAHQKLFVVQAYLWERFAQFETTLIILSSLVLLTAVYLRFTVMYLPDLIERTPKTKTGRIRPSKFEVWFFVSTITVCGIMFGEFFKQNDIQQNAILVNSLSEVQNWPAQKYFVFEGNSKMVSEENFFYGLETSSYKGRVDEKIVTQYGGLVSSGVSSARSIYLYTLDDYVYGRERNIVKAKETAEGALRHQRREFQVFFDNGGYFELKSIPIELMHKRGIILKNDNLYYCCSVHYMIISEPSSLKFTVLFFALIFYFFSLLIPFLSRNDKIDSNKYRLFQSLPSIRAKLFGFKYNIGGIKRKHAQNLIYQTSPKKETSTKIKETEYCSSCGSKKKWRYREVEDNIKEKIWRCTNPSCGNG